MGRVRVCLSRGKSLIAGLAILAAGCVDSLLPPRAHDINQSTQNVRESAILLNLVRASRSEPLNFIALSKFTGTGSASFNQSFLENNLVKHGNANNVFTGGAATTSFGGGVGNSFDVGTLENRDFYGGFMSPLDLESLNLLMNAGLNREIVFHSVLHGVRVANRRGEPFLYENKPDDDAWTENGHVERNSPKCKALYPIAGDTIRETNFEPILRTPIWQAPHERDCRYQKFLFFLRLAVRYGITVEAVPLSGKAGGRGRVGAAPKASSRGGRDGGREKEADGPSARYVVCFDPAIALENGLPGGQVDAPGACGRRAQAGSDNEFRFLFHESIGGVVPIVRSPYAIFQFYGELLQGRSGRHVMLSEYSLRKDRHREARLLTVERGGLDCFARTIYGGTDYCVPNHELQEHQGDFRSSQYAGGAQHQPVGASCFPNLCIDSLTPRECHWRHWYGSIFLLLQPLPCADHFFGAKKGVIRMSWH